MFVGLLAALQVDEWRENRDYFEAETEKGPWLSTQIEQFSSILNQCSVPIFPTLGNHDISSYWIENSEGYESFQIYASRARAAWIRNVSSFRNGTYYLRKLSNNIFGIINHTLNKNAIYVIEEQQQNSVN